MRPELENSAATSTLILRRMAFLMIGSAAISFSMYAQSTESDHEVSSLDSLLNIPISTAAKYDQKMRDAASSVTVVTSEEIQNFGYRNLAEVMESVRGFYVNDDRNYTYVGARGFGRPTDYNDRILFLVNGHSYNENTDGGVSVGPDFGIDLSTVDHVEIVRGPGSALYGTGAMFSVINIITRKGSSLNGLRAAAEAGSFGRYSGSLQWGSEMSINQSVFLSGFYTGIHGQDYFYPEFDSPETNNGIARGLDRETSFGGSANATLGDFSVQALISSRTKDIPTGAFGMTFGAPGARTLDVRGFLEARYAPQVSEKVSLLVRGYVDGYHYKGWSPYEEMIYTNEVGQWQGGEAQIRFDIAASNRLVAGLEFAGHTQASIKVWDDQTLYTDGNYPYNIFSLYVQDDHQFTENINAVVGLRVDKHSAHRTYFSPRGGLVVSPLQGTTLKFLYGQSFRTPNVVEAAVEDLAATQKANPGLDPEIITTTEIVWEQRLSSAFWSVVSLYNYRMRDLIDPILQPLDPADPTSDFITYYQNIGKVRTTGGEVELRARYASGLSGYLIYGATGAYDGDTDGWLSNSPIHVAKLGASYRFSRLVVASLGFQYDSKRKTLTGQTTGDFLLTNVSCGLTPLEGLRLAFVMRNVFDRSYRYPAGEEHVQSSIEQNGRDMSVRMEYAPF